MISYLLRTSIKRVSYDEQSGDFEDHVTDLNFHFTVFLLLDNMHHHVGNICLFFFPIPNCLGSKIVYKKYKYFCPLTMFYQ